MLPKVKKFTGRCHCIIMLFTLQFRDNSPNIKLDLYVTSPAAKSQIFL